MTDPFLHHGGPSGCLLVHGFSGGPDEMQGLGAHLAGAGHTVLGLRLPGHHGPPDELAAVRWGDWLAAVSDGLAYLRARCATVSLVGFSLGGALALLAAADLPVDRLAILATPIHLKGDWQMNILAVGRHVMPWYYPLAQASFAEPELRAQILRRAPDVDLDDPQVQAHLRGEIRISIGAIDELRMALARARRALPRVRAPILVMHGRADDVAPLGSPQIILGGVSSPQRELVWWDDTGHQMLTHGPHREAIYRRVETFLAT
ncbi:alpha/beta fold hydrolase [Oscillochloris sp. ZM17-4]|uniref:alpha/beta hydrolase n=1 Tax=Oscillochloris sp. ZM17-4 TaxID=2866714 RepID=UPI001C72FC03|nr:alpha/beta fold hydrolase [Oscillochloris sp. ZM17-4]MBX0326941.1 alpha/beta fold hydrolase [Oscillochloris sp. ZM17-4]